MNYWGWFVASVAGFLIPDIDIGSMSPMLLVYTYGSSRQGGKASDGYADYSHYVIEGNVHIDLAVSVDATSSNGEVDGVRKSLGSELEELE